MVVSDAVAFVFGDLLDVLKRAEVELFRAFDYLLGILQTLFLAAVTIRLLIHQTDVLRTKRNGLQFFDVDRRLCNL